MASSQFLSQPEQEMFAKIIRLFRAHLIMIIEIYLTMPCCRWLFRVTSSTFFPPSIYEVLKAVSVLSAPLPMQNSTVCVFRSSPVERDSMVQYPLPICSQRGCSLKGNIGEQANKTNKNNTLNKTKHNRILTLLIIREQAHKTRTNWKK